MFNKLRKKAAAAALITALSLFQAFSASADTKGSMDPDDYLFLTVFRACGVSPGEDVGRWAALYKGYLRSTGDTALLAQVEGYESLSWGDAVTGLDGLYQSVRGWLSCSSAYGTESTAYSLSSSPSPQITDMESVSAFPYLCVTDKPFPEAVYDFEGYHYVFSQAYKDRASSFGFQYNYYFPDGVEIIALARPDYPSFTGNEYYSGISLILYQVDPSSPDGYSNAPYYSPSARYDADGSLGQVTKTTLIKGRPLGINPDICSVMNMPVKVFSSVEDMESYCRTGVARNLFNNNSGVSFSLGREGGLDPELQRDGFLSIGSEMTLPGSRTEAAADVAAFQRPLDRDELMSVLQQNGVQDIVYEALYTVTHYIQSIPEEDGSWEWVKADEASFTGVSGEQASVEPGTYENHIYAPELTQPEDLTVLSDGSLVVKLYYKGDPEAVLPYTVEYYKDGELFKSIPGTVPMFGNRRVTDCRDLCPAYYLPDPSSGTSLPCVISITDHVIKICYKKDLDAVYPYTVEYYKDGDLFKILSGTVPVFGDNTISSVEDHLPEYYLLDTGSGTSLPYTVSDSNSVIQVYYVKDQDAMYSYMVEYYKDGELFKTFSGTVPVFGSSVVSSVEDHCPEHYTRDPASSSAFPYTVSQPDSVIKVCYVPDPADPVTALIVSSVGSLGNLASATVRTASSLALISLFLIAVAALFRFFKKTMRGL